MYSRRTQNEGETKIRTIFELLLNQLNDRQMEKRKSVCEVLLFGVNKNEQSHTLIILLEKRQNVGIIS